MVPKGLKPSLANPSLMSRGSEANDLCFSSNVFHAMEFTGCLNTPSSTHFSLCHLIALAVWGDINNLCSFDFKGKYRKILQGILFLLELDEFTSIFPSSAPHFHLDSPHTGHCFALAYSFRYNMQSLIHVSIFT